MGFREAVKAAWRGALSPVFEDFSGEVLVECLDPAGQQVDPLYDETASEKQYLPPVPLKALWKLARERVALPGGGEIDVDGRVVLRTEDLAARGVELDFASLVTVEGGKYAVVHIEAAGQVGGEHLLTKVRIKEL